MAAGKSPFDRWRKSLGPLRARIEIYLSGRAPSDPLCLTNRTRLQKLKIASFIAAPLLLLVALAAIGTANRLRFDKADPYEQPPVAAAPPVDAPPLAGIQKPVADIVSASTDLEVVNIRIARDAHPPAVTGIVRNKTDRKVEYAAVSYYLADSAGSLVGTGATIVANVEPHGSVAFRSPLKLANAAYVFVRDVHPN